MGLVSGKVRNEILFIEFRDSISRNSFSIRAAEELRTVIQDNLSKCKAIIFSGPGRVFCSGGNLADYAAMTSADPGRDVNRRIADVLDEIERLPIPTICAVQGDCFGGGVELMSAFDVVLVSQQCLFGFWQRKIGLTFGWGGGARLEKRLGLQQLRKVALSGATIGAQEAHRIGLVDRVCIESLVMEEATREARKLISLPAGPVEGIKNLTEENERETFEQIWWSPDHRLALQTRKQK